MPSLAIHQRKEPTGSRTLLRPTTSRLLSSSQQKTKLTVTPGADKCTAEFTPKEDGVYTLSLGYSANDLGGATKYQFDVTAAVMVGQAKSAVVASLNDLNISGTQPGGRYKVGQPVKLTGVFKTKSLGKLQVAVHSPSGWNR